MKLKNDIKKYMTLGAALATSTFMVSCDGDDVTVSPPGSTTVTPTPQSTDAPSASSIVGKRLSLTGSTGTITNIAPSITTILNGNRAVFTSGTSFVDNNNVNYSMTYTPSGNQFTIANIANTAQGPQTPPTQAQVDGWVGFLTNAVEADQAVGANVGGNATAIRLRSETNGATLQTINRAIFENNRIKQDALRELNGSGGTYSIAGNDITGNGVGAGNVNGTTINAALAGGETDNTILNTNANSLESLDAQLNANDAQFGGYKNLLAILTDARANNANYQGANAADVDRMILAVTNAIANLEAIVATVDAEYPKLLKQAREQFATESTRAGGFPQLVVSNHSITGTVTRAFSNDTDFFTEGTYVEKLDCTGANLVEVTAPVSQNGVNYIAGDIRFVASNTPASKTINGAFEINNLGQ